MILESIRLINFRSYDDKLFKVDPKLELIVGPNGIGKTNLLEAVYLVCQGKSFRLKKDSDLIKKGFGWARIEATFNLDGKKQKRILKFSINQDRLIKKLEIDGAQRLSSKHLLPIVVFEPDQMRMITESPEMRRVYLDERISFLGYGYAKNLADYKRVILQRNKLLKQIKKGQAKKEDLFIWNIKMSELAAPIISARRHYLNELNEKLEQDYRKVSKHTESVSVEYLPNFNRENVGEISNAMFTKLELDTERDILTGFSRTGPHRDDWLIRLNGHSTATAASRGEIRTLILSLKLYEFEHLRECSGIRPLVILDDVMSELDQSRRKELLKFFESTQVLVSGVE